MFLPVATNHRAMCCSFIYALVACCACGATRPSSHFSSCVSHVDSTICARSRAIRYDSCEFFNFKGICKAVIQRLSCHYHMAPNLSKKTITNIECNDIHSRINRNGRMFSMVKMLGLHVKYDGVCPQFWPLVSSFVAIHLELHWLGNFGSM